MVNKLFTLLFASVLVFPLSTAVFAQEAPREAKAAKPAPSQEQSITTTDPDLDDSIPF